jgi:hypothetical protein
MSRHDSTGCTFPNNLDIMVRLKSDEMRYLSTSLWTPQLDKQLRRLAAKGLSARQIGEQLKVGRNAVIGRWARLRGLVFRCEVEREKKLRAEAAERRRTRKRRNDAAVAGLRRALAKGVLRHVAIAEARKAGATYGAIGAAMGLSRQRVHQILIHKPTRGPGRPRKS